MTAITPEAPFRAAPRLSRDGFRRLLAERAAPAVLAERDPGQFWDAIVRYGVDPLFIAAMFWHESQMGRAGVARQTRSWGNTRAPTFGALPRGLVPGASGTFPAFRTWLDGCEATCARLVSPAWVYHTRTTIRAVFDHPSGQVWAPAGDMNDPAGYLRAVLDAMQAWADGGAPALAPQPIPVALPPVQQRLLPEGASNRPGARMTPQWVTVHETDNRAAGADALAHARWLEGLAAQGQTEPSWHFSVDSARIVQHLPLDEHGWHAGDGAQGTGNRQSIGIELCVNVDGDWPQTLAHAAWLVARLCHEEGIPLGRIVQHHHWSGKGCPAQLRASGGWGAWLARVAVAHLWLQPPAPVPEPDRYVDPQTGAPVVLGFLALWRQLERADATLPLRLLGRPLAPEWGDGQGRAYQRFERGWLKYDPAEPAPWDIHVAHLDEHVAIEALAEEREG